MALPDAGPAVLADVKKLLGFKAGDATDDDRLARIVAAVNSLVRDLPIASRSDGLVVFHARVVEGANMLAARIWRRKDSPAGVVSVGDFGPVYVQRNDPDVALLLELGAHSKPMVG